tara:strand:+ start:6003 stop:6431 length:429 start_codon:yes stop_codon:yes gene_type:complete
MQFDLFEELPTDVGEDGKTCIKCNTYLPHESFEWFSGANTWRRPECKRCRGESRRVIDALKKCTPPPSKDHTCPICEKNLEEISLNKSKHMSSFVMDHDHEKKMFRGWLCHNCNSALGMLRDNPDVIMRAYKYLKEFKDEHS